MQSIYARNSGCRRVNELVQKTIETSGAFGCCVEMSEIAWAENLFVLWIFFDIIYCQEALRVPR
eukprot:5517800-Pyramimonas_sp.AAC.1